MEQLNSTAKLVQCLLAMVSFHLEFLPEEGRPVDILMIVIFFFSFLGFYFACQNFTRELGSIHAHKLQLPLNINVGWVFFPV